MVRAASLRTGFQDRCGFVLSQLLTMIIGAAKNESAP